MLGHILGFIVAVGMISVVVQLFINSIRRNN